MTKNELKNEFIKRFGENGETIRIFNSPGRVNMIGEHIDYNGGPVLPVAINLGTYAIARKRSDRKLILAATDIEGTFEVDLDNIEKAKTLKWGNYQAGVAKELMESGVNLTGADILYHDTLPHGAGLSSSAAIEVVTALLLTTLSGNKADMVNMALIGQKAERNFVGVSCGIMDQFASAMGKKDSAILLDCNTLNYSYVPFNFSDVSIVITNSNKKRSLAESKYNERCIECEKAFNELKKVIPHITCLADVTPNEFEVNKNVISDDICKKRAEHVVYECDRVKKAVKALESENLEEFGKLLNLSGDSLKDIYEVTGFELDALVSAQRSADGCLGSRMTGAGFGGCTVSIVKNSKIEDFKKTVTEKYKKAVGYDPTFYITSAEDGGREIEA